MKISFHSDVNMISFSVSPSLGLLLIVLLPSYCSNVLPLWLRSGGFSSSGCQFVKQEQVLRGQGASLKDSHYSHLPEIHWCTCFFQYAHHCSSDFFVLSTDMFYPQSPGAVSDFEWQQFSAQRTRRENPRSKLCSHPRCRNTEVLDSFGGMLFFMFFLKRMYTKLCTICLHSPVVTDKSKSNCCQVVFVWGHLINGGRERAKLAVVQMSRSLWQTQPTLYFSDFCNVHRPIFVLFHSSYIELLHLFAWSLPTHPLNDGVF